MGDFHIFTCLTTVARYKVILKYERNLCMSMRIWGEILYTDEIGRNS
jgi:hypothetical protein